MLHSAHSTVRRPVRNVSLEFAPERTCAVPLQDQLCQSRRGLATPLADGISPKITRRLLAFTSPSGFVRPLDLHTCYTPWPVLRDVTDGLGLYTTLSDAQLRGLVKAPDRIKRGLLRHMQES